MTQPTTTVDTLISRLRAERKRRRLSKRRVADLADLHPNTLAYFDRENWAPSIFTLNRLEAALLMDTTPEQQPSKAA